MNNPCDKCIVQAACEKQCDRFVDYLTNSLRYEREQVYYIAQGVRRGKVKLLKNDSKWRRIYEPV